MMAPFPVNLVQNLGPVLAYIIFGVIGFAFGYVLEIAGFGNSKLLAAQFYFKDLTVLKVMFMAIIVAMTGVFLSAAVGLLDYNLVYVNPTYLWPGIVGGLVMGVGFIVGGFCPGTSLVGAATGKIDAVLFVLGVFFGIFVFGETVGSFNDFFYSSYMGRFTLPQWLGLPTGWVVLLVILMALFMFWGGEQLEKIFGGKDPAKAPKVRYAGAAALIVLALVTLGIGQPTNAEKWQSISAERQFQLDAREVQIHPGELLATREDSKLKLVMLDVRSEADYNVFHLLDAEHVPLDQVLDRVPDMLLEPANTVFVVMSNDEAAATEAWKLLVAEAVPNVYILEGGINNWLATFDHDGEGMATTAATGDDQLAYVFDSAVGSRHEAAYPNAEHFELEFTPKIKLELKRGPAGGGCG
ncbi:MAG: YeeE/YedE family protein [Anaerolineales bacterium]|nr:YeeE/YedE family protein [Anaerolineales bacterium]